MLHKIFKNSIKLGVFTYAEKAVSFFTFLFLTKYLTPEDFGIFALATVFFTFLLLPKISLEYTYVHSKDDGTLKNIETHLFLQLVYFFVAVTLTSILVFLFSNLIDRRVALLLFSFSIFMFFQSFSSSFRVYLEKQIKFTKIIIINFIATLLSSSVAVALAFNGFGIFSLVVGGSINSLLFVLTNFFGLSIFTRLGIRIFRFDVAVAKYYLKYAFFVMLGEVAIIFISQADKYYAGLFLGLAILGLYERSYKIVSFPTELITDIVSRVLLPVYSNIKENKEQIKTIFYNMTGIVVRVSFLFILIIFFSIDDLVFGFFGNRWAPLVDLVRLLCFYSLARSIFVHNYIFFISTGKARFQSILCWIQAVLLLIATPVTIKYFRINGVILSVTLTLYVGVLIGLLKVNKTLILNFRKILFAPVVSLLVTSAFMFLLSNKLFQYSTLLNIVVKASFGSLMYIGLLFAMERKTMTSLIRKLAAKQI